MDEELKNLIRDILIEDSSIIKEILKDNLTISVTKESDYYGKDLVVSVYFGAEEICSDSVVIEFDADYS